MKNDVEYKSGKTGGAEDMEVVFDKKEIPHEGVLSYAMKEKKTKKNKRTSKMFYDSWMDQAFYEMCVFE